MTKVIYQELCKKYTEHYGPCSKNSHRFFYDLYCQAEKAKHDICLPGLEQSCVDLSQGDEDFSVTLTEQEMAEKILNEGIVDEIVSDFLDCFQEAGCSEISRCELIGGNTRVPVILKALKAKLKENHVRCEFASTLNCDESIAIGTALYAAYKADPDVVGQSVLMNCIEQLNTNDLPTNGKELFRRQSEEGRNGITVRCSDCEMYGAGKRTRSSSSAGARTRFAVQQHGRIAD